MGGKGTVTRELLTNKQRKKELWTGSMIFTQRMSLRLGWQKKMLVEREKG